MPHQPQREDSRNFAAFVTVAGFLIAAAVAPGCDDVTARSFGSNVGAPDAGAGLLPDGGLARGHGGANAISVASGGAGGRPAAAGGAGGASTPSPASGGIAGSMVSPTGTGGIAATGGAIGSGGTTIAIGSGGNSATGGVTGTGGVASTGGVTGTGGVTSTGGVATGGHAGAPGATPTGMGGSMPPAGPSGAGGMKAPDGDPQDQADPCAKLSSDYDAAVTKAKSCNAKSKGACAKPVPAQLSGCGAACTTFVDDDGMVNMIQQKWAKAGCVPDSCAVSACISPTGATCSGDDKGTCADTVLGI